MARKPVTTGPEQEHERTRALRGLKSPALVVLETTPYLTQRKNSPFENNQIQSGQKGGGIKGKTGEQIGERNHFEILTT